MYVFVFSSYHLVHFMPLLESNNKKMTVNEGERKEKRPDSKQDIVVRGGLS